MSAAVRSLTALTTDPGPAPLPGGSAAAPDPTKFRQAVQRVKAPHSGPQEPASGRPANIRSGNPATQRSLVGKAGFTVDVAKPPVGTMPKSVAGKTEKSKGANEGANTGQIPTSTAPSVPSSPLWAPVQPQPVQVASDAAKQQTTALTSNRGQHAHGQDRGQKTSADGLMTLAMAHQSATAEPGLVAHASQGVENKTLYNVYNSGYISSALPASVEPSTPKTVEKSTASAATDSASAAAGSAVMESIGKPSPEPIHGRGSRQVEPGLPAESSGAAALSDVKTTATTWRADSVASNIRGGVDTSTHAASTTAHGPMRSGAIAAVATGTDAALPVVPPLGEMISQATSGVQGAMTASPSEGPASSAPVLDLGSPGWQQVVAHQVSSATHGQSISLQTNPIHLGPIHIQVQRGGAEGPAALQVNIQASQPETVQLLQQSAPQLAQQMTAAQPGAAPVITITPSFQGAVGGGLSQQHGDGRQAPEKPVPRGQKAMDQIRSGMDSGGATTSPSSRFESWI